jgi:hypothetical protein
LALSVFLIAALSKISVLKFFWSGVLRFKGETPALKQRSVSAKT